MHCYDLIKDILVPLISAIIGGAVTMVGVVLTIRWEKKKDDKARIDAAKPWLYSFKDVMKCHYSIKLSSEYEEIQGHPCTMFIKNAGTGIGIISKLQTAKVEYMPAGSGVLETNTLTSVTFYPAIQKENFEKMRLFVSDIYDNQYEYEVLQEQGCDHHIFSIKAVSASAEPEGNRHVKK